MGTWSRIHGALTAGVRTFWSAYNNVRDQQPINFSVRQDLYEKRWQWYNNTAFKDLEAWRGEKSEIGLYRFHRSIYNPTYRLVEFYVTSIYPGVLTTDARRIPDGTPVAIPLALDTPQSIRDSLGVIWEWSNWQDNKSVFLRYAAATGDVLVKIVDDLAHRKVYAQVIWPGLVKNLELDHAGNVKSYELEYNTVLPGDPDQRLHKYNEIVTGDTVRYTLDDKPHDPYGYGAEHENPYGFVPAVWWRFVNLGGTYGAPAIWATQTKIGILNDLASLLADHVSKVVDSPILISGASSIKPLVASRASRQPTDEMDQPHQKRYELNVLTGAEGARMQTLELTIGEALNYFEKLLDEVEKDHPVLSMYRDMRKMTQTTGPAADALIGDVKNIYAEKAGAADVQTKKLFQMAIAIAGFRASRGDWGSRSLLDYKRKKFLQFDLESYEAGKLDFDIDMRPPVPLGRGEFYKILNEQGLSIQSLLAAGIPLATILKDQGWDEARFKEVEADFDSPIEKRRAEMSQPKQTADTGEGGRGGSNNQPE